MIRYLNIFILFFQRHSNKILIASLTSSLFAIILIFINFYKFGAAISSDTLDYFSMADDWVNGKFPVSKFYSPGYPLILACFSYVLNISFEDSSNLICLLTYIIDFFLLIKIFKICGEDKLLLQVLFSSFIMSMKQFTSIFLFAHADSVFLTFHLFILLLLFTYLKTYKFKNILFLSFAIAASLWIKSNSIVYLLFIPLVIIFKNKLKTKKIHILVFVLITILSYASFLSLNGSSQSTMTNFTLRYLNLLDLDNMKFLISNINDLVTTINSLFINPIFAKLLNLYFISYLLVILLIIYFIFNYSSNDLISITYILVYCCAILFLQQYSNFREVGNRTLISSSLTLMILFFAISFRQKKAINFYILILVISLNLIFSFASALQNLSFQKNDTISTLKRFYKDSTVIELKRIIKIKQNPSISIYSNHRRLLAFAFQDVEVKGMPEQKYFYKGQFHVPDSLMISKRRNELLTKIKHNKSLIVIIDYKNQTDTTYYSLGNQKKIGNNLIIY